MSVALLDAPIMAKEPEIKTKTVRLMADLVDALRVIATAESLAGNHFVAMEYLDELVRSPIMERRAKAMAFIKKQK